jgi:hypothetical protein
LATDDGLADSIDILLADWACHGAAGGNGAARALGDNDFDTFGANSSVASSAADADDNLFLSDTLVAYWLELAWAGRDALSLLELEPSLRTAELAFRSWHGTGVSSAVFDLPRDALPLVLLVALMIGRVAVSGLGARVAVRDRVTRG